MNAVVFYCSLVLCVSRVYSVTISTPSPAMQRRNEEESCTFQWTLTGNVATYNIKLLSSISPATLGPNTNTTFDGRTGVVTLFIWNIKTSNAGNYSLSIPTGASTEINSVAVLFVYSAAYVNTFPAAGPGPFNVYDGDQIELNCSVTSKSFPPELRTKIYYFWNNYYLGIFRNISAGYLVLQNGDLFPRYSIKNDGKTLVISSIQYADSNLYCSAKEEGSPYNSINFGMSGVQFYSKPGVYQVYPASRKSNTPLYSYVNNIYFYYRSSLPLTSYTNWTVVTASGSVKEYPVSMPNTPLTSGYIQLSFDLNSVNLYGNYSITLTNSYGSATTTFQVLPPGPPDTPSNFSVQYVTHNLVALSWRCLWYNGDQQTVFVRLMGATNGVEVETQTASLDTDCYNSVYTTLFQNKIQKETEYQAILFSINTFGSSNVLKLTVTSTKRLVFSTSPVNISIMESQATIDFSVADSTKAILMLNISCCVELTVQCSNKSYTIANTDNQIVYDNLPTGNEYVFDFTVFDSDGYTYVSTLAILKGVRVSRGATTPTPGVPSAAVNGTTAFGSENPLFVPVIVLAVLLGIAVLVLIGVGFLVCKYRRNNSHQLAQTTRPSVPTRNSPATRESENPYEDNYEPVVDVDRSNNNAYYKSLGATPGTAKRFSATWSAEQSPESGRKGDSSQSPYMNPDEIFYTRPDGTLDRPKRNR